MRAFASPEVLESHYNAEHGQNEQNVSISESDDMSNNGESSSDIQILRDQIQNLQLCLAVCLINYYNNILY